MNSILKVEKYELDDGEERERMSVHTHLTLASIESAVIDLPALTVDNLIDRIMLGCETHDRELPDNAIFRISVEVDVEPGDSGT